MMNSTRFRLLLLFMLAIWLGGCTSAGLKTDRSFTDRRPADFMLGVVVFGDSGDGSRQQARYIVDAAGNLRASIGAGSDENTYPKLTRRLSSQQLDRIWTMIEGLKLGDPITGDVILKTGCLIEIRSDELNRSWNVQDDSAEALIEMLAELAWING